MMNALQHAPQPKSGGAPPRNFNSLKNGSRSFRLVIGDMPRTMHRQQINALKYRRALENQVRERKGEITLADAHQIDAATQGEIHAAVCRWLLKTKLETMSVADVVTCSREIVRAKLDRNRAFDRLGLDRSHADTIAALYDASVAPDASQGESAASDTSAACDAADEKP